MKIRLLPIATVLYLFMALQGCATAPRNPSSSELAATSAIPLAEPALDHYIAWIPRDKAQTATVAEALARTTLGSARQLASDRLCNGAWVGDSAVTNVIGPIPVWANTTNGSYPAWYYRISHLPGLRGCTAASDAQLYKAMEASLPGWIRIMPARLYSRKTPPAETVTLLD
jgi:hypothetical protein